MLDATRFPWVEALSPEGRACLAAGLERHRVPAGRLLIRKGESVGGAYLVEKGLLRIYELGPTGREQTLYWVGEGESCILALNCVFSEMNYPAWVEVDDEETMLVMVKAEAYRQLFATESALQKFTFDVLSERVVELTEALAEAGTLDVEQRIINLLLRRCDERGRVRLNQERIARHVGTAREVVSRTLRRLQSDGLVEQGRGSVTIVDIEALADLLSRK